MALRPVPVDPVQLSDSATTLYTADTGCYIRIDGCTLTNPSGGAETVTLYRVASGGSANATSTILDEKAIADQESYPVSALIGQWLEPGGTIQGVCSTASAVSLHLSLMQYTP